MNRTIPASKFKAHCLQIMGDVHKTKIPVLVTKRSSPLVKIVPVDPKETIPLFGCMKGTVHILGDIVEPNDEEWDCNAR